MSYKSMVIEAAENGAMVFIEGADGSVRKKVVTSEKELLRVTSAVYKGFHALPPPPPPPNSLEITPPVGEPTEEITL